MQIINAQTRQKNAGKSVSESLPSLHASLQKPEKQRSDQFITLAVLVAQPRRRRRLITLAVLAAQPERYTRSESGWGSAAGALLP